MISELRSDNLTQSVVTRSDQTRACWLVAPLISFLIHQSVDLEVVPGYLEILDETSGYRKLHITGTWRFDESIRVTICIRVRTIAVVALTSAKANETVLQ